MTPPLATKHNRGAALGTSRNRQESAPHKRQAASTAPASNGGLNQDQEHQHQHQRHRQQRLAMSSSRLNGADVSEDLSQLNGAAAAASTQDLGNQNTARVSFAPSRVLPGIEISCTYIPVKVNLREHASWRDHAE